MKESIYILQFNREWLNNLVTILDKVADLDAAEARKYVTLYQAVTQGVMTDEEYQKQVIENYEASKPTKLTVKSVDKESKNNLQ